MRDIPNNKTERPLSYYAESYARMTPQEISARCGLLYDEARKGFAIRMLGHGLLAAWPDFELRPEPGCPAILTSGPARILLLRYLTSGAYAPGSGKFLTYRELPWGQTYDANFQGRCIKRLAYAFGPRTAAFKKAFEALGGRPAVGGDAACELCFLGGVCIRLTIWDGDEEFPPSSQILFSDSAAAAFSAEDLAVVGDIVIGALKEINAQQEEL